MSQASGRVCIMIGADDDKVPDKSTRLFKRGRDDVLVEPAQCSRWAGLQADEAIARCIAEKLPGVVVEIATEPDELLSTEAQVVLIISYHTQPSFAWYGSFFAALRALEARGVAVYPRADFKELLSCKGNYTQLLQRAGLPICPTAVLERAACVDGGGVQPTLVEASLAQALDTLGLLAPIAAAPNDHGGRQGDDHGGCQGDGGDYGTADNHRSGGARIDDDEEGKIGVGLDGGVRPFQLVSKPSNADGGYGVAFWAYDGACADSCAAESARAPNAERHRSLLDGLRLQAMLTCGCDVPSLDESPAHAATTVHGRPFMRYLQEVGFLGDRPQVLLQPLVPLFGQHFELKIYFLKRRPFFAALVYGKEKVLAKVVRPSTDNTFFAYIQPLVSKSIEALDALPADGEADPKILMRVDWGVGAPLLPSGGDVTNGDARANGCKDASRGGGNSLDGGALLHGAASSAPTFKKQMVWRATSLSAPQRKLQRLLQEQGTARIGGEQGYFINEVELHPGFYVDVDAAPDETIEPLAHAYGEYIAQLLETWKADRLAPPQVFKAEAR